MLFRPLAVYIHWPFCKSKCPYCDFNSHVREGVEQERWKKALLSELEYMAGQVPERTVTSIFFGGGTPSLMPPATAEALIKRVHELWSVAGDIEITLEANPTSVEAATFADFKRAGINRVSLGVQSLNDAELKFLGREHSAHEALKAVDLARQCFARYSFDLIYARPHQTLAAWEAELSEALRYIDGHMSLYQLTIEENTAFHHAYAKGGFTLPDELEAEALYRLTEQMMGARGLQAYEVSNYAKPGQESRHNLAYWKGYDYVGVGPGAHGRITINPTALADRGVAPVLESSRTNIYAPVLRPGAPTAHHSAADFSGNPGKTRIATQTLKSPERWLENTERSGHAVEVWQAVEAKQEIEERLMMGLRLKEGIDYAAFKTQTGHELKEHISPKAYAMAIEQGLLESDANALRPTLKGRLVLNTLTAELLAD